jgi:HAD superfamily phosphatase (TIGR01668 family)
MPFSLLPDIILPHLTDVTPELLTARGVDFLMLDFDNTVVPYITDVPTPEMVRWLGRMKASPVRLCVVSNSHKPRVEKFCEKYGLDCITHAKKPFQRGIRETLTRFSLDPGQAALVGDQIYTDVLGANCGGLTSILIRAINNHTIWLKLRHVAELPFIALGKRRIQHEKH